MGFLIEKEHLQFVLQPPSTTETPPIRHWVPPVQYLDDLGGQLGDPIEFTERDIRLIANSLPPDTDPKRLKRLTLLLREWARVGLRFHLGGTPLTVLARRRKRLEKIAKKATALIQALDKLEGLDRWSLVEQFGLAQGLGLHAFRNEQNKRRVDEWRHLTAMIATAAAEPTWKPGRGQPRNVVAQLVLMDLAALFEDVTGLPPTRSVSRTGPERGRETGRFLNFARAVWPVIFGNGDAGLESQLKEWDANGRKRSKAHQRSRATSSRMGDYSDDLAQ